MFWVSVYCIVVIIIGLIYKDDITGVFIYAVNHSMAVFGSVTMVGLILLLLWLPVLIEEVTLRIVFKHTYGVRKLRGVWSIDREKLASVNEIVQEGDGYIVRVGEYRLHCRNKKSLAKCKKSLAGTNALI